MLKYSKISVWTINWGKSKSAEIEIAEIEEYLYGFYGQHIDPISKTKLHISWAKPEILLKKHEGLTSWIARMVLSPFGRCSSNAMTIQLAVKKRNTNVSKKPFFPQTWWKQNRIQLIIKASECNRLDICTPTAWLTLLLVLGKITLSKLNGICE